MQYELEQNFYRPLAPQHTFRLLILDPGHVSHPVSIRLQVVERTKAPAYDAISYVWGDPRHKVTIACDGRPFEITFNLFWALVRIRSPSHGKILWADAICINQADLHERSVEVTFMDSVYSNAEKVYICMGDAGDGREVYVQSVIQDAKSLELGRDPLAILPPHHPLRDDSRWYALATLTANPWFGRTWVIQEAALAKDPIVLYGRAEFGYRDLITVLGWLNASPWSIKFGLSSLFIHLEWADWRLGAQNPAYGFVDLLSHAALLSCSDPRDKVYAFLGHPLGRSLITNGLVKPDYQKSSEQVFLELSQALLQVTGLRVLTTVEHTHRTILEDFPSWVTRWDVSLVMNDIFRVGTVFFASAGLTAKPPSLAGNNLILQGIIVDKVVHSFEIYFDHQFESGIMFENTSTGERRILEQVLEGLYKVDDKSGTYSPQMLAFCSTLVVGGKNLETECARRAVCLARVLKDSNQVTKGSSYTQTDRDDGIMYFNEAKGISLSRTLVVTEKGVYGLAPLITRPGDAACVIVGVDVPFILRPQGDVGVFRLLGESYIHGTMEGQVKGMVERKEVFEQSVVIS